MVPVAAPARRRSLRRAIAPVESEAARSPRSPTAGWVALLAALTPACSIGLTGSDTLAEPALPVAPLTIADADVLYTDADDEAPDVAGLQVTLRVNVADEAIERVVLHNDADGVDLSQPVHDDLDGERAAFFLVTLPFLENPVRAAALVLPAETRAVVRALSDDSLGR
ncbi:MAG: hypothetical protein A2138_15990 [Deltaproteobacteria bacterium RBG_16_71_12]|nr:MAG: hypothetical protein A2138_15990 [Deltaproteobacteria bacterium RBG_16_71_12]